MQKSKFTATLAALAVMAGGAIIMACSEEQGKAPVTTPPAVAAPEAATVPAPAEAPVAAPKAEAPVVLPQDAVAGVVKLDGPAPKRRRIKMDADPKCAAMHAEAPLQDDLVVSDDGGVQYAFVYVKAGLEGKTFDVPKEPAVLDQKGCRYDPHVVGVMIGQDLLIRNSDDLLHNVHALPFVNREFNFGQPTKGLEEKRQFTQKEIMVKVKCDVHPWMSAWIGVVEHPFFAVTDASGKFSIKGLPDGKYTFEVWQEKYKSVSVEAEVKGGAAAVNFTLKDKKE
jgi:hypothetical protein